MKTSKAEVHISIEVVVEYPEEFFSDKFMEEFRGSFYPFHTVEEHIDHLASLYSRGYMDSDFVEGYGNLRDAGFSFRAVHWID